MHPLHLETIIDPDGQTVTVARRSDPIGALFVENKITRTQRDAVASYVGDLEALAGHHRAPSRGPADIQWRAERAGSDRLRRPMHRVQRVGRELGPSRFKRLNGILSGAERLTKNNTGEILRALDTLSEIYGLATPTRH